MKFQRDQAQVKTNEGYTSWAYSARAQFAGASVEYVEVKASHGLTKNTENDRVYYVLDGKGEFIMNSESVPVQATDVVIVPKDNEYDFWAAEGQLMKLLLVHAPAFAPEAEVRPDR